MENNQASLNQMHFRHLSVEEIENPFIYINTFCNRETTIHYFRQNILDLLKTAYSYKEKFYSSHSPNYGYDQQQLIRVMEAVYVLYARGYDFSSEEGKSVIDQCCCLGCKEVADISHFLEDFFDYKDLDEWREYLDDILLHAYKEGGVGYFEYDETPFRSIGLLAKFVEAIFLIYTLTPHERADAALETPLEEALPGIDDKNGGSNTEGADGVATDSTTNEVTDHKKHDTSTGGGEVSAAELPVRILSEKFLEAVHDYFALIDPRFVNGAIRYILLNYLREGFDTGFGQEEMLAELMFPLQRLFELFDLAEQETADWNASRVGSGFVN